MTADQTHGSSAIERIYDNQEAELLSPKAVARTLGSQATDWRCRRHVRYAPNNYRIGARRPLKLPAELAVE